MSLPHPTELLQPTPSPRTYPFKLICKGLPKTLDFDEREATVFFQEYGTVAAVKLETGYMPHLCRTGAGYVVFKSRAAANKAIRELNGKVVMNDGGMALSCHLVIEGDAQESDPEMDLDG